MVMRVDPPVEVDVEVFDAGAEGHVGDAAERKPEVIAERMGGDALPGERGKAGVDCRREVVAVGVVVGGERGGFGVLRGGVEGAAGSWFTSSGPPGTFQ